MLRSRPEDAEPRILNRIAAALSACLLWVYLSATDCGLLEALRLAAGAVALWGAGAVLMWRLNRRAIRDVPTRLTLSLVAAYALTTCWFFVCASVGAQWLFILTEVALALVMAIRVFREHAFGRPRNGRPCRIDWVLVALVMASLCTTVKFKIPFEVSRDARGTVHRYLLYADHLHHLGMIHQLDHHIPPLQASTRGGTPERAYHSFSQLTTLLLARYTGSRDLLRVHLLYHYTVIETLICLGLFAIARVLTRARGAGYLSIVLAYPLSISWPALRAHPWPILYFTVIPGSSSGLEVVAGALPQMYSSIAILYGVMLAILALCAQSPRSSRMAAPAVLGALLTAATMRFHVQEFIGAGPGFLAATGLLAWRSRSTAFALVGALVILASAALYLEMLRPEYLAPAHVGFGYNDVVRHAAVTAWPSSRTVRGWLVDFVTDSELQKWLWLVTSVVGFAFFDVIGIPLTVATLIFVATARARPRLAPFSLYVIAAVLVSLLGGMLLATPNDLSLPIETLAHTRWYLTPIVAPVLWQLIRKHAGTRVRPTSVAVVLLTIATMAVGIRRLETPERWWWKLGLPVPVIADDEWQALRYVRDHTPPDAVILAARRNARPVSLDDFVISGLSGRASYLENGVDPVDQQALRINPADDRAALLEKLWSSTDSNEFCNMLERTPATYVLDLADRPLSVRNPNCMRLEWQGPQGFASIWRVERRESDSSRSEMPRR
jgi:hypothetical protein